MIGDSEKLQQFSRHIVLFPAYHHAYALLKKSIEMTQQRGIPTSAMIVGPSGCGKSTLCELFRDSFGGSHENINPTEIATIRPAFFCTVPSPVTVKSFAITILRELGCKDTRGDTVELTYRVMELLRTCSVQVCVFDEFQWLARPELEKHAVVVIDWLITLINYTKIPIILAGLPECKDILEKREAFARRYPYIIEFNYLDYSESPYSDYVTLLTKLDEYLYTNGGLQQGLHLTDTDISAQLYAATQGSLEYIRLILHGAFQSALVQGRKGLCHTDFSNTFPLLNIKRSLFNNPFNESISACYKKIYGKENEDSSLHSYTYPR